MKFRLRSPPAESRTVWSINEHDRQLTSRSQTDVRTDGQTKCLSRNEIALKK